jgi:type 1 glutamine amidotransferase
VTKGFRHSSIPTAEKVLQQIADRTGEFVLDYARTDEELTAKTTTAALAGYDGVIFANTTGMLPLADNDAFAAWIAAGHAFIGMHSATDTLKGFEPFVDLINGSFKTHGAQATVEILNVDPDHPATAPFDESFIVKDEIYIFNSYKRENAHVLLTLDKHPNTGAPGHYPISWNKKYGKGNVFYTSLGHREDIWESIPYQLHIIGGMRWALKIEAGESKPQSTKAKLSRADYFAGFVPLFNGENTDGWKIRRPDAHSSWSAQDGMLVNELPEGGHGVDLITEQKFEDFVLKYEYMVPKGSNSGVYLRGRYEIQILEDRANGEATISGNGSLYNVKAPRVFASRGAGEWQEVEARIEGNKVSVKLNGEQIHDRTKITKATGSELDRDYGTPGAIMFQGDHGAIAFRNVRIRELNRD